MKHVNHENDPIKLSISELGYNSKGYFKFEKCKVNILDLIIVKLFFLIKLLTHVEWLEQLITFHYVRSFPDLSTLREYLFIHDHFGYLKPVDKTRGVYYAVLVIPKSLPWLVEKYQVMILLDSEEQEQGVSKVKFPFEYVSN